MATNFSLKIDGLEDLIKNAKKAGNESVDMLKNAMVKSTTDIQNEAKRIEPGRFKNQTGNLRRNIFKRVEGPHYGIVYVSEKYGQYVEEGTRPHVILPKRGKYLVFKNSDGRVIHAKKVRHPGSKPYPFMKPAFDNNRPKIERMYELLAERLVNILAGR